MRDLGVDTYRFSVAWPRVLPGGSGAVNHEGLDFYSRLVDELLGADIEPAVTLYHWDLPQVLEDAGGWRVRDTAYRFAEYAEVVAGHLGDRVSRWITLNEPWCSAFLGYGSGRHAPGAQEGEGALAAAHHLLLGHGLAVPVLRAADADARVGITLNLVPTEPVSSSEQDVSAAHRVHLSSNLVFTDPVLAGRYPDGEADVFGELTDFGFRRDEDLAAIAAPLDFLGVNYYFPARVQAAPHEQPDPMQRNALDLAAHQVVRTDEERTSMGWPVEAAGLTRLLVWLPEEYPGVPPIEITENGRACDDVLDADGQVHDPERIRYVATHLDAVSDAITAGVDVRAYFYWSLLDNFEWAEGFAKRFGIVYVDYESQRRVRKDSFEWYREQITARRPVPTG
jgi:beta-glucosidase